MYHMVLIRPIPAGKFHQCRKTNVMNAKVYPLNLGDGIGKYHDQADAEWIVMRTQLRGHNDTPFGRPALGRPSGRPGSGRPSGVFCMF